jgi:lipid A 3-O-deacylase
MRDVRVRGLRSILILCVALSPFSPSSVWANDSWRVVFNIDNDVIVNEDRHYTNGLFLEVIAPQDQVPGWMRRAAWILSPLDPAAVGGDASAPTDVRWGVALGHEIYTPENSARQSLDLTDRPYAGYVYARYALARDRHRDKVEKIPYVDTLEIDVGVVGPAALARQSQDLIHDITNSPKFQGWDNQLRNEPALTLRRSRSWRLPGEPIELGKGIGVDLIGSLVAELGNVKTAGTGGLLLRAGWRLPADFGRGRFVPRDEAGTRFRLYAFAGAEFSAVVQNIFLDGNTFRDSHQVDKRTVVVRVPFGLGFVNGRFRSQLSVIWNSKEFEDQDGEDLYGHWSIILDY